MSAVSHRCGDCGAWWEGPEDVNGPCPSCGSPEGDWIHCPDCLSCGIGGCCDYFCNRCKHHHDGETQTDEPPRDFGDCSGPNRIRYSVGPPSTPPAPDPASDAPPTTSSKAASEPKSEQS